MVADDPLDCAPRQKPMTREDIEAHVHKIIDGYFDEGGGWAASSGLMETLNVLAEHDAAQRETIARLEGELQEEQELTTWWGNLVRREQIGTKKTPSLRAYIEQLEARMTASEAAKKWTTARPTVAGWYWVQWPDDPWLGPEIFEITQPNGPDTDYLEVNDTPMDEYIAEYPSVEFQGPLTPGEE